MTPPVIRPLRGRAEYVAAVELQRRTWGEHFSDLVPPSILMVAQEMGGIASGAFDGDRLVGFVFGISGIRRGVASHWSDMLAVEPGYQGAGLGRRLKLHQRERLLAIGIERMLWTFDPLVARNAHLNLTRLGAIARTYKRDAYGETDSPLHAGLGTDRIIAEWEMASERVEERLRRGAAPGEEPGGAPAEEPGGAPGEEPGAAPYMARPDTESALPRPGALEWRPGPDRLRLAIPADIHALRDADPELGAEWRRHVRAALEGAFAAGYMAVAADRLGGTLAAYTLAPASAYGAAPVDGH